MNRFVVNLDVARDHPAYAGHFPGRPLLPGALLLAEVMEAALQDPACSAALGPTPRLGITKFVSPVSPGTALAVEFELAAAALRFEVRSGPRLVASGHFQRADRATRSSPTPAA